MSKFVFGPVLFRVSFWNPWASVEPFRLVQKGGWGGSYSHRSAKPQKSVLSVGEAYPLTGASLGAPTLTARSCGILGELPGAAGPDHSHSAVPWSGPDVISMQQIPPHCQQSCKQPGGVRGAMCVYSGGSYEASKALRQK